MILDVSYAVIILAVVGTPILLGLMFLPALFEIRKPSDAGPRLILSAFSQLSGPSGQDMVSIADIDGHYNLNLALIPVIAEVVDVLTSIEL